MKVGDYVRVNEMVHDAQLPESKAGLVVELYSNPLNANLKDVAIIMFDNGEFLKFHISSLELLNNDEPASKI